MSGPILTLSGKSVGNGHYELYEDKLVIKNDRSTANEHALSDIVSMNFQDTDTNGTHYGKLDFTFKNNGFPSAESITFDRTGADNVLGFYKKIESLRFGSIMQGRMPFGNAARFKTSGKDGAFAGQLSELMGMQKSIFSEFESMTKEFGGIDLKNTAQPAKHSLSYIDELKQLADLRDKGIITEGEFQKEKKEILYNANKVNDINCPYCGISMRAYADKCPSCGAPIKR